jgi:hypothetical protein
MNTQLGLVLETCRKYNIIPQYNDSILCDAIGIGDILFRMSGIKNKIITKPFYINLNLFTRLFYETNPIIQLEFRIQLIIDIIIYNNIDHNMVKFVFSNDLIRNHYLPYTLIKNYNLKLNNEPENITEDYIIFHTKCRHRMSENYSLLKEQIYNFCKNRKSKYKIIIMGERSFEKGEGKEIHKITTVYNELLQLKNNNDIIDRTLESIYENLDYNNYKVVQKNLKSLLFLWMMNHIIKL